MSVEIHRAVSTLPLAQIAVQMRGLSAIAADPSATRNLWKKIALSLSQRGSARCCHRHRLATWAVCRVHSMSGMGPSDGGI